LGEGRRYLPTLTWMVRGLASSRFGSVISRTPSTYEADVRAESTLAGSVNERADRPKTR